MAKKEREGEALYTFAEEIFPRSKYTRKFRESFAKKHYLDVDGHAVEDGDIATGGVVELAILQLDVPLEHNYFILHYSYKYIFYGTYSTPSSGLP